jgi:hypothetical protein
MNITLARYVLHEITREVVSISCIIGEGEMALCVPVDPANSDYAEIMRQVEAGELTIQDADD